MLQLQQLKNKNIFTHINYNTTYINMKSFFFNLLILYNNKLHYQFNTINKLNDCKVQFAVLNIMQSFLFHFIQF